jgi:hypothetical protein
MNRTFVVSVVVLFVVMMLLGFAVHGLMLGPEYARLEGVFRSHEEANARFGAMIAADVLFAIGLTWIYRQGRDGSRSVLAQGIRFGLAIAVVKTVPTYLIYYTVTRMPSDLVAKQIVFDIVATVILGLVTAALNRDYDARPARA